MERKMINDTAAESVTGGSIVFNGDHTTCGFNCNDQYKVLDYNAVINFIVQNRYDMTEKKMIKKMVELGLLATL